LEGGTGGVERLPGVLYKDSAFKVSTLVWGTQTSAVGKPPIRF
jgi:hypothetical protein